MWPAALILLAAVLPASAQYSRWDGPPPGYFDGRIPPEHVDAMVRDLGYTPIAHPRPRGPLWVTHAVDRDGNRVRVLIDGFTGRVIDVLRSPRGVAVVPRGPRYEPEYRPAPRAYPNRPPQAAIPEDDLDEDDDDEGPPANQPRSAPRAIPQRGPAVIPYEPRGQNNQQKKTNSAAVPPAKQTAPSPKSRPPEAPRSAQSTPAPEVKRAPESTGAIPPVQPPENQKSTMPPVQPLE